MGATAEILAIGTEILLGEIQDTNTRTLAQALRSIGLDLYRTAVVGDNADRIAQLAQEAMTRSEVVITAGGLGPTVDDATREGIARAIGAELVFHPELWEQVQERFARYGLEAPENNRRQAHLPAGAVAIENPVGTAPAFYLEVGDRTVVALPGVPAELSHLLESDVLPYLRRRLGTRGVIKSRIVRTAGVGESWLDERIADLERLANPTVGLAAHPGRVDIRITAKANSEAEADEMLWGVEATLQQRLGQRIYGVDDSTLEQAVLEALDEATWRLTLVEVGTGGALTTALSSAGGEAFCGSQVFPAETERAAAADTLAQLKSSHSAEVGLLVIMRRQERQANIYMAIETPADSKSWERSYGGAPPNAPRWVVSLALDRLRRSLLA